MLIYHQKYLFGTWTSVCNAIIVANCYNKLFGTLEDAFLHIPKTPTLSCIASHIWDGPENHDGGSISPKTFFC